MWVITIAGSSFAQTKNIDITAAKKIATDECVTSLKIYDNVEVVLTEASLNEIAIIGEKTGVENTQVKIINGELTITGSPDELFCENVVVYVPSKNLSSIYIHGRSIVSSTGIISNEMLDVTINGEGKSAIKTSGMMSLNTISDFPWVLSEK